VMNGEYFTKTARFGFIDRTSSYVIAPKFDWAGSFSEGVAPVCTGPCRFPGLPEHSAYGYTAPFCGTQIWSRLREPTPSSPKTEGGRSRQPTLRQD
jgi:hypothetical protein